MLRHPTSRKQRDLAGTEGAVLIDVKPPLRTRLEVLWHQLRLHIVTFAAYPNSWPVSYYCRNCGTRWCGWADYLDIAADRQIERGGSQPPIDVADALLDERREFTDWAPTRKLEFSQSQRNYPWKRLRSPRRVGPASPGFSLSQSSSGLARDGRADHAPTPSSFGVLRPARTKG